MKKFLKYIFIVALVAVCIAGTCFVFFKIFNNKKVKEVNLAEVVASTEKVKFTKKVEFIDKCVNVDETDARFSKLMEVDNNLTEMLLVLTYDYAEENFEFKDEKLSDTYNNLERSINDVEVIIDEYTKKATTKTLDGVINEDFSKIEFTIFPKNIGANDLFVAMSRYIVNYAKFVQVLNSRTMARVNFGNQDAKFHYIEIYTNIAINTFSELNGEARLTVAKDLKNINAMDNIIENNGKFNLEENAFGSNSVEFINNYSNCDKTEFCKNLAANLSSVKTVTENSSAIEKATYYFTKVYGV